MSSFKKKKVLFLRHGQATHNPRAEEAKRNGCSHERFLELMQQDDEFDSKLTEKGIGQANATRSMHKDCLLDVELVVSSPLSRALKTADLTICPENGISVLSSDNSGNHPDDHSDINIRHPKRICIEELREINGWLLNAKRRKRSELEQIFNPRWNFDSISEEDETWDFKMEKYEDCGERGYLALLWLLRREEDKILAVTHGGLLKFSLVDHPLIKLLDGRDDEDKRFSNCEMREYEISFDIDGGDEDRPVVTLTEITKDSNN